MPTNRHGRLPRPLDTLDLHQTGELLNMGAGALARWARQGKIAVIKMGKVNRYQAQDVRRIILENNRRAVAERLVAVLEKMVEDNNAAIAREAQNGRRKD